MLLYPVETTHTINNRRNRPHATRVFAKNRKRPPFSTLPCGNNLKNAIFRTFLTKKVTFFTIFLFFSTPTYPTHINLVPLNLLASGESISTIFSIPCPLFSIKKLTQKSIRKKTPT